MVEAAKFAKQREHHQAPLNGPAALLLSEIREQQANDGTLGEYVFPGGNGNTNKIAIKRAWSRIIKAAKIDNFRLHDLRHSFASEAISSGASLSLVGGLLGHSAVSTTQRYAHLYQDALRSVSERVGAAFSGKPAAAAPTPIPDGALSR
jgi:site-specific recombinase XerD